MVIGNLKNVLRGQELNESANSEQSEFNILDQEVTHFLIDEKGLMAEKKN